MLDSIARLKRKRFAPSSEQIAPNQLGLFDEAEPEALSGELEQATPPPVPPVPDAPAAPPKTGTDNDFLFRSGVLLETEGGAGSGFAIPHLEKKKAGQGQIRCVARCLVRRR
ncbi:transposase [uncultured Thiodictyon sp.]|uniref:transposase n=1 Tax=uncultured Thiodictyon sp. TaxID=1846217 RepID=UPI0034548F44